MTLVYTPYVGVLLANGLITALITFLVLRHRTIPGKVVLAFLMFAAVEVSLANTLEVAAVGIPAKVFWAKIGYIGNQSGPVLFLVFALQYTHQDDWLTSRNSIILWLIPLATMLMAATNDWHKLVWTSFTPSPDNSTILIYGHGFWFWASSVYDYSLVLVGSIALFRAAIHVPQLYRRQIGVLLAAAIVPGIGNIIYLTGLTPVAGLDTAPITFSLAGLILTVGVLRFGLFDILPIARDVLIENMSNGVLVLDVQDRVVDINPVAQKLIGKSSKDAIGQPIEAILAIWSLLSERHRNSIELQTEVCLQEKSPRYFDLHITPLRDQHKHFLGRLVIFQDTTQRKLTEIELARNFEQLGIINRINQAITSGLDLDHVLKTLREQCTLVAPIDIFYVALYDETTSLIQIPLYYERGLYQTGPARDISESPGNIGKVIQTCRTLYLHDIEMPHTGPLPSLLPSGTVQARSYVGIPLILRDKAIGAMAIQSHKPNAYTDDQIGLIETIAVQAAIAIGNARLYAEVQRLAIIDELTDLYNYRGLIALGAREVERARRFTRPLSALFFDIDRFKELNDRYSHATGNLVLHAIAQCCQSTLRSVDLVARYGGDEFVVLLPETDPATAQEVANRLNRDIAALHIPTEHGELGVTVSIGVTELDEDIKDIFALVDRANQGEHQAKEAGGNRYIAIAG